MINSWSKWFLSLGMVLVLVSTVGVEVLEAGHKARVQVQMQVPVMQEMVVMEPLEISARQLRGWTDRSQPLIIRNIGRVQVRSNANWLLKMEVAVSYPHLQVSIRPATGSWAPWQNLRHQVAFNGNQGLQQMSWDLKVEWRGDQEVARMLEVVQIEPLFTLTTL